MSELPIRLSWTMDLEDDVTVMDPLPLPKNELSTPSRTKFFKDDLGSDLWIKCKCSDFQIVVDDCVLHVHKCILAVRSLVFSTMLTSGLTETKSGQLIIQDFDYDIVQRAIWFIYSERFGVGIKSTSIWELIRFGHKYDIQHLIQACLHQIMRKKNFFDDSQIKFFITSAVYLGVNEILDSILSIFGAIKGKIISNSSPYPAIGDVLFQDDSFKDLKIICSGQEFFVHKCILALKSQVFTEIFDKMAENDDTSGQLTINRIKPIVFENAISFFYSGVITSESEFCHYPDLFLGLLSFADRFKVKVLVISCLQQIDLAKDIINKKLISTCIENAVNFESKKILDYILGIFGAHRAEKLDFNIEKVSYTSYWD